MEIIRDTNDLTPFPYLRERPVLKDIDKVLDFKDIRRKFNYKYSPDNYVVGGIRCF